MGSRLLLQKASSLLHDTYDGTSNQYLADAIDTFLAKPKPKPDLWISDVNAAQIKENQLAANIKFWAANYSSNMSDVGLYFHPPETVSYVVELQDEVTRLKAKLELLTKPLTEDEVDLIKDATFDWLSLISATHAVLLRRLKDTTGGG